VALWHNNCCNGNATIRSFYIAFDFHTAVSSVNMFGFQMELKPLLFFALLSTYKIFRTVFKNINILRSSREVPDISVRFQLNLEFRDRFS
jgi:hypothetical protein